MSPSRRLIGLFRPYLGWLIGGIVITLLTVLANIGLLALSGWFITSMGLAGLAGLTINYFTPAAGIRGLAIGRTGGRYLERLVTHEATFRLLAQLRLWVYRHLEPRYPARLQGLRSGDLLNRITNDIDTLDHFYLRVLTPSLVALGVAGIVVGFTGYFVGTAALALGLGFLVAGVVIPWATERAGRKAGHAIVTTRAELQATVVDGVQGLGELAIYGATEAQAARIDALSRQRAQQQQRMARISGASLAGATLITGLTAWGVLLAILPAAEAEQINAPIAVMLVLLTLAAFEAVAPLPGAWQRIGETQAAAQRLFEIVDTPVEITAPADPAPLPEHPDLRIEGLGFHYDPDSPWVLKDIDLHLPPGGKVGLIGATGAGKSSLVQILLRFWPYDAGEIYLGGHPLRACDPDAVRARMAVISQETQLFSATVRENLQLAHPGATQRAIEAACRTAQIHHDIQALEQGYDTHLGAGGIRLSAGQSRRLAIARALLKDAPLLLLDEPTEGLDPVTQDAVLAALQPLIATRSVLFITHHVLGLEAMDQILVLEDGEIRERGRYEELRQSGPRFRTFHGIISGKTKI